MKLSLNRLRQSPHTREAVGLILCVLGLFCLGALLSYDAADSSWFSRSTAAGSGHNWFGWFGATLAETVLQLFGTAGFLAPFGLGVIGWRLLRPSSAPISVARRIGYTIMALSLCALLELLYGNIAFGGERLFPAGGVLGRQLAGVAEALFNRPGALLLMATALAATVILTTRVSFVRTAEIVGKALAAGGRRLASATRGLLARVRRDRQRRRDERRAEAKATQAVDIRRTAPEPRRKSLRLEPEPEAEPAVARDKPIVAQPPRKRTIKPPSPRQAPLPMTPGQRGYTLPSIDLLNEPGPQAIESEQELLERARLITEKLKEFAVLGTVVAVHPGPVVTTFEFKPEAGIKYSGGKRRSIPASCSVRTYSAPRNPS